MSGSALWLCEECKEPIANGEGYVAIENSDPESGPVPGDPRRRSDDLGESSYRRADDDSGGTLTFDELMAIGGMPKVRISWRAVHGDCDRFHEVGGYRIAVERIATPEAWLRWLFHLGGKSWIGAQDLRRGTAFWFLGRGGKPFDEAL